MIPRSGRSGRGSYMLVPSVQAYVAYLQARADGGDAAHPGLARLAAALAQKVQMSNLEVRRGLLPTPVIEQVIDAAGERIAEVYGAIPSAIARRGALSPEMLAIVETEVRRAAEIARAMHIPRPDEVDEYDLEDGPPELDTPSPPSER